MKLSKTGLCFLVVLLLAGGYLLGRFGQSRDADHSDHSGESTPTEVPEVAVADVWTCSMHPQVQLPEPGKCPMCGMDLILAPKDGEQSEEGPRVLQISESARALAGIETAKVERRSVAHEVHMVGKIAFDETRVATITSWVPGRLDRLFVDYTGVTVREGDHLVEIYSPTLYSAQQELLQAIRTAARLEGSGLDIVRSTSDQTVVSAREKLKLYGLSDVQIEEIIENGVPNKHVTVYAPIGGVVVHKNALEGMYVEEGSQIYTIADLSQVWVLLEAYESDLAWLRYGQTVEFQVEAYPGEVFHGRIAFIDQVLNDRTRTVNVRLNVDNSDARLKPEMFVSAKVSAVLSDHGKVVDRGLVGMWMCPMHPEIVREGAGECPECGMQLALTSDLGFVANPEEGQSIVIPATAPLLTGRRAVVYVRLPNRDRPTFEGRVVELGPRAGDWYVVRGGLEAGEDVVVHGNFKIDSELQIRARPSMMSPEDGAHAPVQDRGGMGADTGMAAHDLGQMELTAGAPLTQFRGELGAVLDAYLALQQALAADQDGHAEAQALRAGLAAVDMTLLEGDAHTHWMNQSKALSASIESIVAADGMGEQRPLMSPLTDHLVVVLKSFGFTSSNGPVGLFHCSMARSGEGGDWLQVEEDTKNPYYGASMLSCGSRTELLSGGN